MTGIFYAIAAGMLAILLLAVAWGMLVHRELRRAERRLEMAIKLIQAVDPERLANYLAEREQQAEAERRELEQWSERNREYERQFAAMMAYTGTAKERGHGEDERG